MYRNIDDKFFRYTNSVKASSCKNISLNKAFRLLLVVGQLHLIGLTSVGFYTLTMRPMKL